ncbi:chloramphenicol acetyltransferase-like domain protein [Naviculisporaceae sp. PSN 640]
MTASQPPYGRRLLPQILQDVAVAEPDRILYSIAKSSDISEGFRTVSARVFLNAVDKTAWLLYNQLGENLSPSVPAVAYIGPHDLRHILLAYACVKAGYTALFLSPKNSTQGALAVLEAANCRAWAKPRGKASALVEGLLQQRTMEVVELPELEELLNSDMVEPFPYSQTFESAMDHPFCILHTSGSTGLPKPVAWSHGLIGTMDAVRLLPPTDGDHKLRPWTADWDDGDRIYSSFPMSHGAGIIMNILLPALFRLHCIMGPPGVIPNMNLIESLAEHGEVDIWSMIPSLVDELGETPDVLARLSSSKFICASGGPVSPISGGKVNDVVRVLNLTGTTEGLFIGNLWVDREDWFYFAFHPFSGFEFKEIEPGLYEHWVHRNEHAPLFQGIFHTFPEQQSINLKDLYQRHPTKPYLWSYKGRNDDVVVLSNGYKISPLDTEAFVSTHPAVEGCLMIGSGKPQAGLLVELKDAASSNNDQVLESIWAKVESANAMSLHKNQLQKDYIAFAQADKPFVRTDKRTIKRRATLELYAEYIDRFYDSRSDEEDAAAAQLRLDTSSLEALTRAIRDIVTPLLLGLEDASSLPIGDDADLFGLGLDSILAFRVVKSIRVATGLHDKLTVRHMYGNPTIAKLAGVIWRLLAENNKTNGVNGSATNGDHEVDPVAAKLNKMLALHRARLSAKVNPFDLMNPNIYVGMKFYLALREDADFEDVFARLQEGLRRTMQMIPELEGRVMRCSEDEEGYKKGDLRITLPPLPSTATSDLKTPPTSPPGGPRQDPRQLAYKDLSAVLPSFDQLRAGGFAVSAFDDSVVLDCPWFPRLPADVLVAQANFVKGGCILAINVHHAGFDGIGVITAMRAWAENCRYVQGDRSATCDWLEPDSLNRGLLHILYELEGYAKPASQVDPNVWGYLGFPNPALIEESEMKGFEPRQVAALNKTTSLHSGKRQAQDHISASNSTLPKPPPFPRKFAWPPVPPADGRSMRSTTFLIPADKIEKLRQRVLADLEQSQSPVKSQAPSISDILQAFFWRAAIRARYRVETQLRGKTFSADDISIVEMPIDARTYFSNLLPSSYMGSCLVTNRPYLPVQELCSPSTSLSSIASIFRAAAAHITPSLVHDAFTLLQSVPDYTMITNACMGLSGMHCMMNNMMLFRTDEISFGGEFLAANGVPETMRIQMDRFNTAFRLLVILPMRKDGGIELLLGTLPEEFAMLINDKEFMEYAEFLG